MPAFEVAPDLLRATAAQLRTAVDVARHVHDGGRQCRALAAATGDDAAQEAVHAFLDRWSHGMGLVAEDADRLGAMLVQAAEAYEACDRGIAGACS
jgi:hypothetical protein